MTRIKQTFSDFHSTRIDSSAPVLPFTYTLEVFSHSELIFRVTIPGCLFIPLVEGEDGKPGRFKRPTCYGRKGRRLPGLLLEPPSFIRGIEIELRRHKEVQIWIKKVKAAIKTDPSRLTSSQRELLGKLSS